MELFSVILSFFIGLLLILFVAVLFSMKTKGVYRLLLNTAAGGLVLFLFGLLKVAFLPVNPVTALLVGALGVPGLAVVIVISVFA